MNPSKEQYLAFFAEQQANNAITAPKLDTLSLIHEAWFSVINAWQVLEITGADALSFLQGQISCDMEEVRDHGARLGCCVNLQGRIISNFIVNRFTLSQDDSNQSGTEKNITHESELAFIILCPASSLAITKKTLEKYAIFSKVSIKQNIDHLLFVSQDSSNINANSGKGSSIPTYIQTTATLDAFNMHFHLVPVDKVIDAWKHLVLNHRACSEQWFEYSLINKGLAFIEEDNSEKFTPQEINFDLVNGISFTKGCYTGQEVVARLHYRGKTKRHAYIASIKNNENLPRQLFNCSSENIQNTVALSDFNIVDANDKSQGHVLNHLKIDNHVFMLVSLSIKSFEAFKLAASQTTKEASNEGKLRLMVVHLPEVIMDYDNIDSPAYL